MAPDRLGDPKAGERDESPFRRLPPVHAILDEPAMADRIAARGRSEVVRAVRRALDDARSTMGRGQDVPIDPSRLAERAALLIDADRPGLRPVINATGVLIHTGLGRSPLAAEAVEAVARVARGYSNLEFDLETGQRGRRTSSVADLLRDLTGAEAATVVNNNAGATLLALRALARDREVVVSRGQLVEIGGSYRLPDVFEASGARLREVGTTNKTRLNDYEAAIGPETAALLRVHPSNYRIVGFSESVGIGDLAKLAHSRALLAIDDIGSGALASDRPAGVSGEPTVLDSLAEGADLVLASGDKLLGGPQCGLMIGRLDVIRRIEADPMARALRVDKMTIAALEATLRLARDPDLGARRIPLWTSLTAPVEALRRRAETLAARLRDELNLRASAVASTAFAGGGSAPDEAIPSAAVRVDPPMPGPVPGEEEAARALRLGAPAVVARVRDGALWFDLRAVPEAEDETIRQAIAAVIRGEPSAPE